MTNTPVQGRVEMLIGDEWVDVTEYTRQGTADSGGGISIQRGVPNEGNIAEPTQLNLTLNNAEGRFSPKNPNSANYGLIGRNTPIRYSVNNIDEPFTGTVVDGLADPEWSINGTLSNFDEDSGVGRLRTTSDSQQATRGVYGDVDVLGRFWIGSRITGAEFGNVMRQTQPVLIDRWDFEASVAGWTATDGTLVQSTAQKNAGAASALLTTTGSPTQTQAQSPQYPTEPGKQYRVRMYVRTATTRNVRVSVDWYDSGGSYFGSNSEDTSVTANTWTYLLFNITAPSSAALFDISALLVDSPTTGSVLYIDDVSIYDYSEYGWYQGFVRIDTTDSIRVGRLTPGAGDAWTVNLSTNILTSTWYWIRSQVVGQHIRAKVWKDGDPEPQLWQAYGYDDIVTEFDVPPTGAAGFCGAGGAGTNVAIGEIHIRHFRAHAEIAELPPEWDLSREDRWVSIQGRGILRRLGQGRKALDSAVTRQLRLYADSAVYWYPLEDGSDTQLVGSALPNGVAATVTSNVDFEGAPDSTPGLGGVAYFNEVQAKLVGTARKHSSTGVWTALGFFQVNGNPPSEMRLMTVLTSGSAAEFHINIVPGPTIEVNAVGFAGGTAAVLSTDTTALLTDEIAYGDYVAYTIYARQDGGNVTWAMNYHKPGSGVFYTTGDNSFVGVLSRLTGVIVGSVQAHVDAGGMRAAQVAGYNIDLPFVTFDFGSAANAYIGETALARFARLCREAGLPYITIGTRANSAPMGPQLPAKLLDLLQECAEAENGILGENRADFGLYLRGRRTLYNQPYPTLDIDAGHLSPPLKPADDDQLTRNDVTAVRRGGGKAYSIQTSGPLNVNEPETDPDGVGVYDEAPEFVVAQDWQLQAIADQRRSRGTQDEARYPSLTADLAASAYEASPELTARLLGADAGSILGVLNPEVSPDVAEQIVSSYTEDIADEYDWKLTFTATPARVWRVGVLGETTRVDTSHSYTTAAFTSGTSTALLVGRDDTAFAQWYVGSTAPTFPFDVMVAGVRLRVTQVTGASDPQTLTVQQAPINGIIKAIPIGSQVRLAEPWRMAR